MSTTTRSFVAVPLPEDIEETLGAVVGDALNGGSRRALGGPRQLAYHPGVSR